MKVKLADYNPLSPAVKDDPYPYFALMREEAPLHWVEVMKSYFVTRYDDVVFVLKNPSLFSSGGSRFDPASFPADARPILIDADPPVHTRLRNIVNRAFTPRRIAELEPRIREIARELVAGLALRGEFDLIEELGAPLPIIVIAELLGVEPSRRRDFKRWSDATVEHLELVRSGADPAPILQSYREMSEYLGSIVDARIKEPKGDLISTLVRAGEGEEGLTREEMLSFARLLLVAGNETTTNLIGNALNLLVRHPEQLAWLAQHPASIPGAVEEVLRFDPAVQGLGRLALQDVPLSGGTVPKGSRVFAMMAAANRDPRRFDDSERFDVRRDAQGQLAFGYGIHFCLGAPLARLETKVALEELLAKVPGLAFSPKQPEKIDWAPTFVLRGPKSLWLKAR